MSDAASVLGWFQNERGIRQDTVARFGIGIRPDGAIEIPYPQGKKIRRGIPIGERKFFFEGEVTLFNEQDISDGSKVVLVEGETDTMRLWQELRDALSDYQVVGLPGIETWNTPGTQDVRPSILQALSRASEILVIFDNDADYTVQGRVETAATALRKAFRTKCKRVRLPSDVKDVCEFFGRYDMNTMFELFKQPTQSASRWKPLDLTTEPPPVRWLVPGLLCRGDIHLGLGEPGIGKSWLTMALALGVIQGTDWLGRQMTEGPGRVLYLDEENPEDLVFDRLYKLGLQKDEAPRIRYLNNKGIRLDRQQDADDVLDEALDFEPTLIVLDSLTRFHTGDEDKAGAMAALYNDALKPLARETGAAVMLLHHANKSDSNSSYRRSRGSGEIIANADCGFDIRLAGINYLTMAKFKSRRGQAGEVLHIGILDTPEGGVKLIGNMQPGTAF